MFAFDERDEYQQRRFGSQLGTMIGRPVFAVEYEHLGMSAATWRHDFESDDTELWFMADGSIMIRSASGRRLWDTFTVDAHE